MKIKQALTLMLLMWGAVKSSLAADNINPNMTFGSMPVVGVLFDAQPYVSYRGLRYFLDECIADSGFTNCGVGLAAGKVKSNYLNGMLTGFSCPANTASIPVEGFDFTNYNGWNGVYRRQEVFFGFNKEVTYTIKTLCVVPQ